MAKKPPKPNYSAVPPAGLYDPALDAQLAASGRGLTDLMADIAKGNERGTSDYELGKGNLERTRGETLADIGTGQQRSLSDILRSESRAKQDYGTNVSNLQRQYAQLGEAQRQSASAGGVGAGGGYWEQAAQKRAENEALARQPIDTQFQRFGEDVASQRERLGQDVALRTTRTNEATDRSLGQLTVDYQRSAADRQTQGTRAQRENQFFGQDIGRARYEQAVQAGWQPPAVKKPRRKK